MMTRATTLWSTSLIPANYVVGTAAAPASEVEAVVRSPTNMAAAEIAAVEFNKMTSLDRPACGRVRWEDLLANRRLQTLLLL